jgi:DNA repair exonuclease SbcCD ATPase subunit
MEARHVTAKEASGAASALQEVQEVGDLYATRVDVEKKNIEELDKQIRLMKAHVLQQRKSMGGVNAAQENTQMVNKQIRILENRLDKALVKFNEALANNKRLREQIDNLRRERVVFDQIYRRLERDLHEKKKAMANIIELSNQSYETRDAAQMEIAAIQQAETKERTEHEEKMSELARQIEADKRRRDVLAKDAAGQRGDLTIEQEQALKKKVAKGMWGLNKEKAAVQTSLERVQSYEEAFNKIKAATGIADIEELVATFIANEDQNFSLFNYVNEQNNEVEKAEEQIAALHDEERKYARESGDDVDQHKQLLVDLAQRLAATDAMAEKYESKHSEALKTINALKVGIQSIFSKIDCNSHAMGEMLADSMVTEVNMMQYLGIIEQRTNELLQAYAAVQRGAAGADRAADDGVPVARVDRDRGGREERGGGGGGGGGGALASILGQGPMTPMGQDTIQISPPNLEDYSTEEESEDEDAEARPLTHDELKSRTMRALHKQRGGAEGGKSGKMRKASSMRGTR